MIPIGTISKGKRLPTVTATWVNSRIVNNWPEVNLRGTVKINDSKLPIIEKGFVMSRNNQVPITIQNAEKVIIVSSGSGEYEAWIDGFSNDYSGSRIYYYRAYAINSLNQVSYSKIPINDAGVFIAFNYCEQSPCMNNGTCISTIIGPICICAIDWCDNCCSLPANNDPSAGPFYCPGNVEYQCTAAVYTTATMSLQKIKYYNSIIKSNQTTSIWNLSSKINTTPTLSMGPKTVFQIR